MEEWRDIKGYEGLYKVSNSGKVVALNYNRERRSKERVLRVGKGGYLYLNLYKNNKCKTFKIHRLVAEAFIPNPKNFPQVNHKDEDKSNNNASNLEWCTCKYNNNYGTKGRRTLDTHKQTNSPKAEKPIAQLDCNGNIIATYISISEGARQVGVARESLRDCVLGKQKTCKGYNWTYLK